MPRVKVNELLKHATENRYGVAAVNTLNVETVKYVLAGGGAGAGSGDRTVLSGL